MSASIWKFELPTRGSAELQLPAGAAILTAQNQNESLVLWAAVDPKAKVEKRRFEICVTGGAVPPVARRRYIGTAQFSEGAYVAHVFEVTR